MPTRLLLVENDQALVDLLERYLTRSGYEVSSAPSAQTALELLHGTGSEMGASPVTVALAIVDFYLTDERTGVDLLTAMREAGHNFPVLLYSGYPFAVETLPVSLQANVWFLQKPFMPKVLSEMVVTILGSP